MPTVSSEVVRTRTGFGRLVVRVEKLAGVDREASAADAGREPVAECFEGGDAAVDVLAPTAGQPLPVASVRCAVSRQSRKGSTDPVEGNSRGTPGLNQRDPPKHGPLVAALVSRRSARHEQAFFLVEAEG